jgi:hypothetical protein
MSDLFSQGVNQTSWPSYTSLTLIDKGEINLTAQGIEIKIVVWAGILQMLSTVVFVDLYPDHLTQLAWGRKILVKCASTFQHKYRKHSEMTAQHYATVKDRLRQDDDFSRHLTKVVRGHILPLHVIPNIYDSHCSSTVESVVSETASKFAPRK